MEAIVDGVNDGVDGILYPDQLIVPPPPASDPCCLWQLTWLQTPDTCPHVCHVRPAPGQWQAPSQHISQQLWCSYSEINW